MHVTRAPSTRRVTPSVAAVVAGPVAGPVARIVATLAVVVLALSAWTALAPSAGATTDESGSSFTPLPPCRILDTRATSGGPTRFGSGETRDVQVAGSGANFLAQGGVANGCGVPDGVAAVEVTITAVQADGAGFVRAWPSGQSEPNATVLNYSLGRNISNSAAVPLASSGTLDLRIRNAGATTHLLVDVLGYYDAGFNLGSRYVPVTPCRVADSRVGAAYADGESRLLRVAGTGSDFQAQGGNPVGCGIPEDATAVELTLTATAPTAAGFVRAWAAAGVEPTATVLNFVTGQGATNTASVPVTPGVGADLSVRSLGGPTHLIVDVQGYWTQSGSTYAPVTPCRIVDTRTSTPLGAVAARPFRVGGSGPGFTNQGGTACGVPEDATAVEVSFTAVGPPTTGFARLWPGDRTEPIAAALNFGAGQSTTNTGTVALSSGGLVDLLARNYGTGTHYLIDVLGYFSPNPEFRPFELAVGSGFACASFSQDSQPANDFPVRCWGRNTHGQLGNDSTTTSLTPVPVPGATGAVDLDAGADHVCAVVDPTGPGSTVLRCWGRNTSGQIGDGTFLGPRDVPTNVTLPFTPRFVAAGALHTCASGGEDGQFACWGENGSGQLGIGNQLDQVLPQVVTLPGISGGPDSFAAGTNHTCAVVVTSVQCWGSNALGQLGVGSGTPSSSTPLTVPGIADAVAVAAGDFHTCVLRSSGGVSCWGEGSLGQLGDGDSLDSPTPVTASFRAGTEVDEIEASGNTTCVIEDSAAARCWGAGVAGQIGDGAAVNRSQPTVVGGYGRYDEIVPGAGETCGVTLRRLECWGSNDDGGVGDGTFSQRNTPVTVQLGPVRVAAGDRHACALRTGGSVWCWGQNSSSQVGDGSFDQRTTPVPVAGTFGNGAVSVQAGGSHSCLLREDGTVWCWGGNASGQTGSSSLGNTSTPAEVTSLGGLAAIQVTAGAAHTCVLLVDRTVRCWGDDSSGQLGDGTPGGSSAVPVSPVGLSDVISVSAGATHSCAVRSDGTARCWGDNSGGLLGRGTTGGPVATPGPVVQLAGATSIHAGRFHTCATLPGGAARCWGANSSNQLGDGTTTASSVPVTVLRATPSGDVPATGIQSLAAGGFHSCSVSREGLVDLGLCWGSNFSGQLGGGVSLVPGYPQLVTTLDRVRQVTGGRDSSCAIAEEGAAYCWGDNSQGQLGRGTTSSFGTANPTPVEVTGLGPI